jgi:hypothetical protein
VVDPTKYLPMFAPNSGIVHFPKHVLFRILDSAQDPETQSSKEYGFGLLGIFVKEFMMLCFMNICYL